MKWGILTIAVCGTLWSLQGFNGAKVLLIMLWKNFLCVAEWPAKYVATSCPRNWYRKARRIASFLCETINYGFFHHRRRVDMNWQSIRMNSCNLATVLSCYWWSANPFFDVDSLWWIYGRWIEDQKSTYHEYQAEDSQTDNSFLNNLSSRVFEPWRGFSCMFAL